MQKQGATRTFDTGIRPIKAIVAGARLVTNLEETEHFFSLMDAIDGPQHEKNYQRFLNSPSGALLDRSGFCISSILSQRDYLQNLPTGSLGHAYLSFLDREGLTMDELFGAVEAANSSTLALDPSRRRYHETGTAIHDLMHVLTGYGRDAIGEACLLAFTAEQFSLKGVAIFANTLALREQMTRPGISVFRMIREARSRAREMAWTATVDWRDHLESPLSKVRANLNLTPTKYYRDPAPLLYPTISNGEGTPSDREAA